MPLSSPIPANPAPARTGTASRVLRAGYRPSDRLPHPSWRAATGHAASPSGRRTIQTSASAKEFWDRLGL